ncbi:gliding motility protein GldN [Flavobacterium psychrophilum]|uniref:Gliding motility protein GldN n=1 Tax=Flavobacterium psychrophilum TaxID=96345 RepID=A0A7U2NIH3_FLAPS|nr:gliding motility protein GldN [Flavobacterium psychrophilum]EKT3966297.1 gliding motility protein GldN [Flavobacterium psychrophilum]EKT4517631.1 gliding motility protein GldN [Flavobacterium psychrophilum]ELM3643446.1 gliding motility protein GldN [Flavobacterium psychrophilum]OAE92622.1 gliding motility protein GldN [Flavobacterium psychrophilum]OUD27620.1 gliding motility protein GldN [Flavobacterium psychrophilum]
MNWRNLLVVIIFIAGSSTSFAQSNLLNAKNPKEIGLKSAAQQLKDNDKPLEYGYVDDRDILMSKKTWEIIDLDERINFPLYYPIDTSNVGSDRRSLYDVLVKGIKSGKITEVYGDSYFREKKTLKDINASLTKTDTTDAGREQMNEDPQAFRTRVAEVPIYEMVKVGKKTKKKQVGTEKKTIPATRTISEEFINKTDLASIDVSDYKIVGLWYFDKRQSDLRYRILGICPVIPDVYTMDKPEKEYIDLFWVFYPGAREILHEWKAFNDKNSAMPITFDDLLNSRRFNALTYKEENVYNDREIVDYMKDNSLMQLLESERVKDKVRNFEQDMWNY